MNTETTTSHELDLEHVLRERFGLPYFLPGQREVIERLMAGRSAAAIFPTGGGKSLCYQLPAVLTEGLTLVVSPLLALMREQVDDLNARGIPADRLDSSLSLEDVRAVMHRIRRRQTRLLYVAPERFLNERLREFIHQVRIDLFAIDEAHCISQWGHNFRPDYLKLARVAQSLKAKRVLALTATATPAVQEDICAGFQIAPDDVIQTPFYRPNLELRAIACTPKSRESLLVEKLASAGPQATIVYVTLQKTAEALADRLGRAGLPARAYHAGMKPDERRHIQDWFMDVDDGIIVATIAFGMGIDKSNIRAIYHYNPSKSLENLAQEIGRAGRDGQPAICETLLVPRDRIVLENFVFGDTPSPPSVQEFAQFIADQPDPFFVSYYQLANHTDIRQMVVRTLLTQLELDGLLEATRPRYQTYRFKPLVPSTTILGQFSGERQAFAKSVLARSVKRSIWFDIDLDQVAADLKCDRMRIVRMMDYFAEKGWVELQVTGLVHGYRKPKPVRDPLALADRLIQIVEEREQAELNRLDELFAWFTAGRCQSAILSEHFGQTIDGDCGHCSACQGIVVSLPDAEPAEFDPGLEILESGTWYIAVCSWVEDHNLSRLSNVVKVDLP